MTRPVHSAIGASSAERWMHCPGSVKLIRSLDIPPAADEEWRLEGTVAHTLAARVIGNDVEPWTLAGSIEEGVRVTPEMVNALYVYDQACRPLMGEGTEVRIECPVELPGVADAYGTGDFASYNPAFRHLSVLDFKYGVGIFVSVKGNPQIRYYGRGFLEEFPDARTVSLGICQPRITWASEGPVRWETIRAEELCQWSDQELFPAMKRTEVDPTLVAGEHCRFCPAKLVCPLLNDLYGAAVKSDPKAIVAMDDETLERNYGKRDALKMYLKGLETEALRRANAGVKYHDFKLVHQKANRVLKLGAEVVFKARFGDAIYSAPELKSPAQLEALGTEAEGLVKEWAYTPKSGLTLAPKSDPRPEALPPDPAKSFAHVLEK